MEDLEFKLISIIYLIGVAILVLPSFIKTNSNIKIILKNLSKWIIIILMLITIMYIFNFI